MPLFSVVRKPKLLFDGEISEEATLTIDGLKHTNVTFPYTTKIRRGFDETVVKIESPNYTASPIIIYGHEIEMYTVEQGEKRDKRQ